MSPIDSGPSPWALKRKAVARAITRTCWISDSLAIMLSVIPSAKNGELKSLLETGLTLFKEHQAHAEQLAAKLK